MKKIILLFLSLMASMIVFSQENNFQSVNNEEFAKIIKKKKVQLIDVRTAQEFSTGHLPKAQNIDMRQADFQEKARKELEKRKNND